MTLHQHRKNLPVITHKALSRFIQNRAQQSNLQINTFLVPSLGRDKYCPKVNWQLHKCATNIDFKFLDISTIITRRKSSNTRHKRLQELSINAQHCTWQTYVVSESSRRRINNALHHSIFYYNNTTLHKITIIRMPLNFQIFTWSISSAVLLPKMGIYLIKTACWHFKTVEFLYLCIRMTQ